MAAPALTPRQVEVIHLAGDGLTMRESARRMGISVNTVKRHRREAFWRLKVGSRTQAAVALWRIEHGAL